MRFLLIHYKNNSTKFKCSVWISAAPLSCGVCCGWKTHTVLCNMSSLYFHMFHFSLSLCLFSPSPPTFAQCWTIYHWGNDYRHPFRWCPVDRLSIRLQSYHRDSSNWSFSLTNGWRVQITCMSLRERGRNWRGKQIKGLSRVFLLFFGHYWNLTASSPEHGCTLTHAAHTQEYTNNRVSGSGGWTQGGVSYEKHLNEMLQRAIAVAPALVKYDRERDIEMQRDEIRREWDAERKRRGK